ncbi:hypothetical protein HSX37_14555|uniref:Uncharacterized protein n=1 Tax=Dendrosporobacter quercicolus TaxID=146817 RepID=A0A1G9WZL4_9FIRM|nr:DUF5693 family protein [Dendrosporobacter quercicolus]NSL49254.1 hypothetical protein [Dendrosporobacter quercicolus DSM 1736]SDM89606.1 hypothetical protein SAMN04488502_108130 [Dendrosporobacter quercicolus]
MTHFKYNRILLVLILSGLLAALALGWQRHQAEESNTTVELVMDYEDVVELAQTEGVTVESLAAQLKAAGLTSLAVYETTLEKLNKSGKITAVAGAQLLHQYRTGTLSDPAWRSLVESGLIIAEDVYVTGRDSNVFAEVKSDLERRLSARRISAFTVGGSQVLALKANYEKLEKWNLGLPSDEMREAAGYGFYVVARPTNYTKVQSADVRAVFDRLAPIDRVSAMMFVGDEVLGYPDLLALTAEQFQRRKLTLGMIEHPLQLQFLKQEGLTRLAAANDYQAARVYVIPKDEQPKLKVDEAVRRWVLTDQERNIRMNLLRKYDKPEPGQTLLETNLAYITKTSQALINTGFTIGRAGTYQPLFPSPWLLAVICVGATAAGVLYLTLVRPFAAPVQYLLVVLLSLPLIVPVLSGGGMLVRQAVALVSAVVFPVLAMTWQLDRWRQAAIDPSASLIRLIGRAVVSLPVVVALSLAGGFYVAAILGDVRYLLEIEIYRGVKLTFVAPLILITLTFLVRYDLFDAGPGQQRNMFTQLRKVLDCPVQLKGLLVLAIAAIAAWVFIGRSGHTAGVPVPALELKLRAFFEQMMYARPRGKEFMIGHPAFFLAVMAVFRQWPTALFYVLVIGATIAQGSLVETFAHIRTPVFMSFVRALDGLAVGILVGVIAMICVHIFIYLSFVLGRRTAKHE